jgi:FkbM family methyltransferase
MALSHFGPGFRGRFLDIGANDGLHGSTTVLLAENGWDGIAIEPSWSVIPIWLQNMRRFPRVTLVAGVISPRRELARYWECGALSTCNQNIQAQGGDRNGATMVYAPTFTCVDLLDAFPGPFDAVSIDIEGWSLDIMREFPWDRAGCRFAAIEAFSKFNEAPVIRSFMESVGFGHLATTRENVVMVR